MAFWGKSWGRSEREDSKTRYFQCGMNARQRLCGYCPHLRAPGALALSLDRERDLEKQGEGKRNSQTPGFVSFVLRKDHRTTRLCEDDKSRFASCRFGMTYCCFYSYLRDTTLR